MNSKIEALSLLAELLLLGACTASLSRSGPSPRESLEREDREQADPAQPACGRIEGRIEPVGPPLGGGRWIAFLVGDAVSPMDSAPVGGDGCFSFESVAPGRWRVAILEERPDQPLWLLYFAAKWESRSAGERRNLQVQAGQTTPVVVRLHPAVMEGTLDGVVRDEKGRPVGGLQLRAEAVEWSATAPADIRIPTGIDALTDEQGRFAMPFAAPGTWELRIQGKEWVAREVVRASLAPGQQEVMVEPVAGLCQAYVLELDPPPPAGRFPWSLGWRLPGKADPGRFLAAWKEPGGPLRIHTLPGPLEVEYWEWRSGGVSCRRRGQAVLPEHPTGPIRIALGPAVVQESLDPFVPKAAFTGRFLDATGRALGPGRVCLFFEGLGSGWWGAFSDFDVEIRAFPGTICSVDAHGRFGVEERIGRFRYSLTLEGEEKQRCAGGFEIPPGGKRDAVLRIE